VVYFFALGIAAEILFVFHKKIEVKSPVAALVAKRPCFNYNVR
jgi:hypothetical protein